MRRVVFFWWIGLTVILFMIVLTATQFSQNIGEFVQKYGTLLTGIPLGLLTFAVQRRLSFVKDVRDTYLQTITSVEDAIYYTQSESATYSAYLGVLKNLSISIESTRGIFRNRRGNYPFVQLHHIYSDLKQVTPEKIGDPAHRESIAKTGERLVQRWKILREGFLQELDRPLADALATTSTDPILVKSPQLIGNNRGTRAPVEG